MTSFRSQLRKNKRRSLAKRGFVMVAVLVLLSLCVTMFGLWARSVLRDRSRVANQLVQAQAVRLAEAGLQRALARRATDAQYEGEMWSVPASELDQTHAAQVRIKIMPSDGNAKLRYEAAAEFPLGEVHRAQITKSVEVPNPVSKK